MGIPDWPPTFERTVRAHLPLLPADQPLTPDLDLTDYGLDSLSTVSLLVQLEDLLAISFSEELLIAETFGTVGGLWSVVGTLTEREVAD